MGVRKITENENIDAHKIITLAFHQARDFSDTEQLAKTMKPEGHKLMRAYFDEDGVMKAVLQLLPFIMRLDGHDVKMGGIANVASLPEDRRRGHVRTLFKAALEEMHAEEYRFSYLFPFSHPYYRQFGYELCAVYHRHTIAAPEFAGLPAPRHIKMVLPGSNDTDVYKLYDSFIADKNLAIKRRTNWVKDDPYKTLLYGYLLRDQAGGPEAYMNFSVERNEMRIHELIWKDLKALKTILGFSNKFTQVKNVILNLPEYIDVRLIFPEPYNIKTEVETKGMGRIVDVKKVLEGMTKPAEAGKAVIRVSDPFALWNEGAYRVEWSGGACEVSESQEEADLECGIGRLSQLASGYRTPAELLQGGDIVINGNFDTLMKLFPRKRLHVTDYF